MTGADPEARLRRPDGPCTPSAVGDDGAATGAGVCAGDEASIRSRADLARFLEGRPERATPALVRRLKERVEGLYRKDAVAARELAECVAVAAGLCGDLETAALAHRARALAALASGAWKEALPHYEAAERLYRRSADEVELGKVLRSAIDVLMHLGRYEEALAAGREARAIFLGHRLPLLAAQVEANVGNVYDRLDRNAESLESYDRALRAFREAGDGEAVAMMEFNRANVYSNLNELRAARDGYRHALAYFRSAGHSLRAAQCLYSLACLAYLRSRSGEALRLFERVRRLDRRLGDRRHAALCDLDQAEVLLSLNAWREAGSLAQEAQRAFEELGMAFEAARAVLLRGLASVHRGRAAAAESLLDEAARRFEREGNVIRLALTDLYRAELALRTGDPAAALGPARAAARLFAAEGLPAKEAYARLLAARALAGSRRHASARRQCELALERLGRSPSAAVAYRVHHLLGRLSTDAASRRRHLRAALGLVERLRVHVLPDELHASFQRDKAALYEDCAAALLEAAGGVSADQAEARLEDALRVVELGRARALGDSLARLALGGEAAPRRRGRAYAEGRHLLEELNACYRRLNEVELGGRGRSGAAALRREIEEREGRLARVFREVELEEPGWRRRRASTGRGLLAQVRRLLDHDEALVEFFFLEDRLNAFVVRRDRIQRVAMPAGREELRRLADRLRFQAERAHLGGGTPEHHHEALRVSTIHYLDRLGELVWRPLAQDLADVRKLVIVPAGPLFYVPFHALRDDARFLVERYEIARAPSARAYVLAHRLERRFTNPPLVLGLERPELPSIAGEIEAIRRRLPSARILTGPRARRGALRRFGHGAPVVHIAAHARFRDDNPLLSAIELADGWLTFYDLFDLRLGSDLVVLSGCQTGRDGVLEGEELVGLSRGFLVAGAAALVASLWPVGDRVTGTFMERFYERLHDGDGPRSALRGAMLAMLEQGHRPHEWAAFYLSGRPR